MARIGVSQNGWPVFTTTEHYVYTKVEGRGFWSASQDAAVVLDDFTEKFHHQIESINLHVSERPGYDDWSWNVRPIRGQVHGYSNHGSASARDLNATRHPRGRHGTYTRTQRLALHRLVNDDLYQVRGVSVLRHGEFYSGTIDGMHVEINASTAAIRIVADRIRHKKANDEENEMAIDKAELKKALIEVLTEEALVPNRKLDPTDPKQGNFTISSVLANVETDQDKERMANSGDIAEIKATLAKITAKLGV